MTVPLATARPRRLGRSAAAVLLGFLATFVLSLGTDQVLHLAGVYPPWGQPMRAPGLNLLALAYRVVYTVLGGWVTAKLAPYAPMRHVWILGGIGLLLATVGAAVTITQYDLGPTWYPIALALTSVPCVWLGGALAGARAATRHGARRRF